MDSILKYNTELKGCHFTILNGKKIYLLGDILHKGKIRIVWYLDGLYCDNCTDYSYVDALYNIKHGLWIITDNDIRKKKLDKLTNGFSRKI